jgi:hypothetical protein
VQNKLGFLMPLSVKIFSVYVINSEYEFAQYFTCEIDPQIDFGTKTLLVAYSTVPSGAGSQTIEFQHNSDGYFINAEIWLNDTDINGSPWNIAIIANKIITQSVTLNLNFIRL